MKKMKSALIWVLVLCMVLPMVAPAYATAGAADDAVVYDFTAVTELYATSLQDTSNATIDAKYAAGDLNWKYIGRNNQHATMVGGGIRDWDGIRYANKPGGGWFAVKIQSPGTGTYTVQVDFQTYRNAGAVSELYILPADTADISAAIAEATALGRFDCNTTTTAYADDFQMMEKTFNFEAGKEYIAVFFGINNGTANNYACVTRLIVAPEKAPEPPEDLDQKVYDLALENTQLQVASGTFATRNLFHDAVKAAVEGYYKKGELDWKYHSAPAGMTMMLGFGGTNGTSTYLWEGLRMYAKDNVNYYVALKIQSPGSGDYQVTVDYMVHKYGAKKGSIYVLPADTTDIADALAKTTSVGSLNFDNGAASSSDPAQPGRETLTNKVKMEAGKEYLLVFQAETIGRSNSYMYVSKVTMTKSGLQTPDDVTPDRVPEPVALPENSVKYNVDLSDTVTGIYDGKQFVMSKKQELQQKYEKGSLNWMPLQVGMVDSNSCVFVTAGLTTYSSELDWYALKIKSPGESVHTLNIDHAVSGNGGIGAIYILPADTEDIAATVDPTNMIGKVDFANATGDPNFSDGSRTNVGTWNFGSDEEYILVVEAYEHTPYNATRCYTYISQFSFAEGVYEKTEVTNDRVIRPVTVDPGAIKLCEGTLYGTTAKVNGHDYLFQPIEGKTLLIFDLDDGVLVKQQKIPFTIGRGMTVDKDGNVWIVGDSPLIYKYDPVTGASQTFTRFDTEELSPGSYSGFDLVQDEEGILYFSTYKGGVVLSFDPATEKYTKVCVPNPDAVFVCGMAIQDGYLYTGLYGDNNGDGKFAAEAVKIKIATGEVVARLDLSDQMPKEMVMFRGAGLCGDVFFLGGDASAMGMIAIDINTFERVDVGMDGTINYTASEEVDGKIWFVVMGKGLCEYDSATRMVTQVPGMDMVTVGLRCGVRSFIEIDDPTYPGKSLVTYSSVNGIPRIYNIETGRIRTWDDLVDDDYGNPTTLRSIVNGVAGSNLIYIGAYNTENCSIYDVNQGKITQLFETNGQTDSLLMYDGVLYAGTYNTAAVVRVNTEDPNRNSVLISLKTEHHQSRIHTLAAGDGKIFFGSVPDRYEYGGCIGWVDLETLEKHVERNVVEDLSINCLIYRDGFLYGTGSTDPGTGAVIKDDQEAKLFIYDVAKKQKVFECDIADYISGLKTPVPFITGIAADPNVEGKFWGMVSETLFSFTYDTETGKFSAKEELSFDKNTYTTDANRAWFGREFIFDDEGYMYVAFENKGGMRKINTNNVQENERIMQVTPMRYVLGEDGNIYYLYVSSLMMYPLNVTEADWKTAEPVDALINAIGDGPITLNHAAAIEAARKAYDALEWKHKALVQNLEKLQLAEADLLELKIDQIGTVTLSSRDMLYSLQAQYESMEAKLQRFVKNYDKLLDAMVAYSDIIDKSAAAEVQAMVETIKSMGKMTLEIEPSVVAIREAYDKLTTNQKLLVTNRQILFDAEAEIQVLRQARIEYLKQLIASIGEVTLEDEAAITEAMEIFNWMYQNERPQVDYMTLQAANKALTPLQKEAAAAVDALILAIGDTIDKSSKDAIEAARKAYDALTEGSKKYVQNLNILTEAEAVYAELGMSPTVIIIIIIVAAVVVLAGGAVAAILILKKKKAMVAEEPANESEA